MTLFDIHNICPISCFVKVLSGLIHCQYIPSRQYAWHIANFKKMVSLSSNSLPVKHGSVLGLCSFVTAFPHDVPDFVPELLLYLGQLLNQKQPVSGDLSDQEILNRKGKSLWKKLREPWKNRFLVCLYFFGVTCKAWNKYLRKFPNWVFINFHF